MFEKSKITGYAGNAVSGRETVVSVTMCGDDINQPSLKHHQESPPFNKSRETEQTIAYDTQLCV